MARTFVMPCCCLHLINERWTTPQRNDNNNKHSGKANQDLFAMGTKSNFGCDWMMLYGGQKCVYMCIFVCVLIVSRLCEQKTNQNKTQKKQSNKQNPQQNCVFNNKLEFHFPPAPFHSSTTYFPSHTLTSPHTLPRTILFPRISPTDSPACLLRI